MNLYEIKEALLYGDAQGVSLFPEARGPEKWKEIRESAFYKDALTALMKSGEEFLAEPIRALRFSHYKIYDTTGSRKEYEDEYFIRRTRLNTFALLSLAFDEEQYLSALEDAIWAICDEYTWCLPAHLYGESLVVLDLPEADGKEGSKGYKSLRAHDRNVDLFASETGHGLAEICSLLEDKLSPLVVHRAQKLVRERILDSYTRSNPMFGWETCDNNWAAVCAGSVGSAALYLLEDSSALAPVVLRVLNSLEAFLSGYESDGACIEGLAYWNYGFGFYVNFAQLLRDRTGGKIDLMEGEKIREIALFQQKCYLSGCKIVNFSDGVPSFNFNVGLTSYLKSRYEEIEIPELKYGCKYSDVRGQSWPVAVRNFVWSHPGMAVSGLKDASYYLKNVQWLVSRKNTGYGTAAFAAKGGHNGESHNHNDVGHFIFHVNGESLLADIGAGEYTKQYFGPERYSYLCNSARGHSVPVINGIYQQEGKEYGAKVIEHSSSEDRDVFSIDIAGAYAVPELISLERQWRFEKDEKPRLLLKDSYHFEKKPEAVSERFVTFHEPKLLEPGKIEISGDSAGILVSFHPEMLEVSIEKDSFSNHFAVAADVYIIDLKVVAPGEHFCAEVAVEIM